MKTEFNQIKDTIDNYFNRFMEKPIKNGIKIIILLLLIRWVYRKLFK